MSIMPPVFFIARLEARGLFLTVDADAKALLLSGPRESRTDGIRTYVRSQKPVLIAQFTKRIQRRAELAAVFGEERVALGEAIEAGLLQMLQMPRHGDQDRMRRSNASVSGDAAGTSNATSNATSNGGNGSTDYPATLRTILAAFAAAAVGSMPRLKVALGPGRSTEDPNLFLSRLVSRAKWMKAAQGDNLGDQKE